ncbi:hypothetical protein TUN199_01187 [Pyrenophora tritici-repentis]|nr:hypothetical protein Alg215_01038 [Pyrenophora tritici-repentis]KAI0626770.1 hypothetical protein TUN199_01187 [Pyrenophora tritici-repentis]KAI1578456.1 Amelogenin domain containing protein [Pyrenophora tritici-repentis]KAI1587378.1 Amelogenin domain containing protein [Pyrenophora tritici-repentis]PWO30306.1 hypothetical protein PtrARCrB10_01064 [Pyrenophora tritici-repentis]
MNKDAATVCLLAPARLQAPIPISTINILTQLDHFHSATSNTPDKQVFHIPVQPSQYTNYTTAIANSALTNAFVSKFATKPQTTFHNRIHETLSYPKITITTPDTNSCLSPHTENEHILSCRHAITTQTPNEACVPNCHHVAMPVAAGPGKEAKPADHVSDKEFYCDACIETANETRIPTNVSSMEANRLRVSMRKQQAVPIPVSAPQAVKKTGAVGEKETQGAKRERDEGDAQDGRQGVKRQKIVPKGTLSKPTGAGKPPAPQRKAGEKWI